MLAWIESDKLLTPNRDRHHPVWVVGSNCRLSAEAEVRVADPSDRKDREDSEADARRSAVLDLPAVVDSQAVVAAPDSEGRLGAAKPVVRLHRQRRTLARLTASSMPSFGNFAPCGVK
jgi:hypothetical protein